MFNDTDINVTIVVELDESENAIRACCQVKYCSDVHLNLQEFYQSSILFMAHHSIILI
jgi:hypothetical protein